MDEESVTNSNTKVEEALRGQKDAWREISTRMVDVANQFPIDQPKRILIFGVGSSHFAARLSALSLQREKNRKRIPVIACQSNAIGSEVHPLKGDWAFGISHRGKTGATLRALEICERAGALNAMVCGKGVDTPESVRFALETVPLETVEPHTISVTSAICALTSFFLGAQAQEEWDAIGSIGVPDLSVHRSRAGEGPTILIGEWEGEWIAKEGALKLMEMAQLPVRSFGTEEFFHGPRFSSTPEDRIWYVSMPNDPREKEVKADYTINVFGKSPLAWVPALLEMQWLALATAINRDVNPDHPEKAKTRF